MRWQALSTAHPSIVLAFCESASLASELAGDGCATIGWDSQLRDDHAQTFARIFYDALLTKAVCESFEDARLAVAGKFGQHSITPKGFGLVKRRIFTP